MAGLWWSRAKFEINNPVQIQIHKVHHTATAHRELFGACDRVRRASTGVCLLVPRITAPNGRALAVDEEIVHLPRYSVRAEKPTMLHRKGHVRNIKST